MIELLQKLGYCPTFCVWELTLACNLRCTHCGSYAGACREDELSLEECCRVADELASLGCERVTLSGGEPTLFAHWHELARHLTDLGVGVNILSNGWSWTDEHLRQAQDAGLTNLAFSLDGLETVHDSIRREGSYDRLMDAIDRSVAAGWRVAIATHIHRHNRNTLPEIRALLIDHGVVHWQLQLGVPSGTMSEHPELVIDPEDLLWLVPLIAEMRAGPGSPIEICAAHNIGYYGKWETALRADGSPLDVWVGCRAGCQNIGIESNGNIKGCLSLPSAQHGKDVFVEGNIRDESLPELWQRPDAFTLNRVFDESRLGGFCAACRYRDLCRGGCAFTAYGNTQNRFDNPYCFYRQAVRHRRFDLLGDDQPNPRELAWGTLPERGFIR